MPPSLALAESACLRASARTFLGRSIAWLRTTGPKERPPPRNRLTRAEPWRAEPVPFCRYIFLPVRAMSARFLTAWVPRWRRESCQFTQRCRMSARASRPKMASGRSTDPAAVPSSVVTLISMSGPLLAGFRCGGGSRFPLRGRPGLRQAELAGGRRLLGPRLLDGVAHHDPSALGAWHRTGEEQEAALGIGGDHLEIERGHPVDAPVARHLLFLEGLARVLAAAGRAERAVRDRHAVGGAQPGEIPALHDPGKSAADRGARHVHELAGQKMIGSDLGPDRDQLLVAHPKLGQLALGLDLGGREMPALGLADVVDLARPRTELERHVAILLLGAM